MYLSADLMGLFTLRLRQPFIPTPAARYCYVCSAYCNAVMDEDRSSRSGTLWGTRFLCYPRGPVGAGGAAVLDADPMRSLLRCCKIRSESNTVPDVWSFTV